MFDPWENEGIQAAYCKDNESDFDLWIAENHPSDYRTSGREDFELSYCEANTEDFEKFAEKYDEEALNWREKFKFNRPGKGEWE